MKKFLGIVLLSLLISTKSFAEVYYCIDIDVNGFSEESGNYERAGYKPIKFKAKIDFDNGTINSKTIGFESTTQCEKFLSQKFSLGCSTKWGDYFSIEGNKETIKNFDYVRAKVYGRGDSIYVAHGNCEKF